MRRFHTWFVADFFLTLCIFYPVASQASNEKVIYSFQGGADGAYPMSDLVYDVENNLYGTTSQGGITGTNGCSQAGCGTVFELLAAGGGWQHKVIYSFKGYPGDGSQPQAGLIVDSAGNLYGATTSGGKNLDGTVFKLSPNSQGGWTETVIHDFDNTASFPAADLVFDSHGNLYGTAQQGGSNGCLDQNGCGAVFELVPQSDGSWHAEILHIFKGSPDGAVPNSTPVIDSSGNVWGVTQFGGSGACDPDGPLSNNGCGTLYELTQNSKGEWSESVLYNFGHGPGFGLYPSGGLLFLSPDRVYVSSGRGGDGYGTLMELRNTPAKGWQQSPAHFFYGPPDGIAPVGRLVAGNSSTYYGVTLFGGANGGGVVFELQQPGLVWIEKLRHSFGSTPQDGTRPMAGPISGNGVLYGTTYLGGSGSACDGGCGTVYELLR
jgi:uncharacterized repeat protein (TIGR03803 family)